MKTKSIKERPNGHYLVTSYEGDNINDSVITKSQMIQLKPTDIDFHCNEVTGKVFIKPENGKTLEYFPSIPGVGRTSWQLIEELMWTPGEFLTLDRLYLQTNNDSFASENGVSALLTRIRRAFGESADEPWYFWTKEPDYAICWHADRTWRIIERLADPKE